MNTVISVEHLSKRYRLGAIGGRTLHEDLNRWWARVRRQPDPYLKIGQQDHGNRDGEILWALRDVSFEVQQGEVLGIIGRNGAGKSTLLKILSQVTAPSEGQIKVKGRIASLLEVGTGFHPELTGRENIYLNGAILGMTKREIDKKFDEIVSFAEVEKFIDTPVKRYSSGMYVRLAFAVAAHLDPEILIVDEVLAVGDAAFQKKCLGKMGDVAHEGRTVLFVSHNMDSIVRLCTRALLLRQGQLINDGETTDIVKSYQSITISNTTEWKRSGYPTAQSEMLLEHIYIGDKNNVVRGSFRADEEIYVYLFYSVLNDMSARQLACRLYTEQGLVVFTTADTDMSPSLSGFQKEGKYKAQFIIPPRLLAPGKYFLQVAAQRPNVCVYDKVDSICSFDVLDVGALGVSEKRLGVIRPLIDWQTKST